MAHIITIKSVQETFNTCYGDENTHNLKVYCTLAKL